MRTACVIGSGFAGTIVARDLARAGATVTILEAGVDRSRVVPERLAVRYSNQGTIEYVLRGRTYRCVGGTSEHWFGNTPRPMPRDLRLRSTHGIADDWPFSFAELEPDLEEAERLLGVAGTADDPLAPPRRIPYPLPGFAFSHSDRVWQRRLAPHGIAVSTTPQARASRPYRGRPRCAAIGECLTCPIEARSGPTATSLAEALGTGAVTLQTEAFVTHLETDRGGRVARAVWLDAAGQTRSTVADLFVVACHVPDSVRLLLHSASGAWPHGLGNREDVVGRYFMDNPRAAALGDMPEMTWPNRLFFQTGAINHWRDRDDRAEKGAFLIEIQNYIPDASPGELARGSRNWGTALKAEIRERWGRQALLNAETEMLPARENRVLLDPHVKDPFGVPIACFDFRYSDYDVRALTTARAALAEIFAMVGATGFVAHDMTHGTLDSCYHPAGGLRMGTDWQTSVTDSGGRVHGVANLFVSGTSLFPSIATANPTLTMVALAVRVARSIRERGARGEL